MGISELLLIDDGACDIVASDLDVSLGDYCFSVPAGFSTDYASTPRILTPLIPKNGNYDKATVIHDYLYWLQDSKTDDVSLICHPLKKPQAYLLKKNQCIVSSDKKTADEIFKLALQFLGVGTLKANILYYSVKFFGGTAFAQNKEKKQKNGFSHKFKTGLINE